jgi:hypothetical protein
LAYLVPADFGFSQAAQWRSIHSRGSLERTSMKLFAIAGILVLLSVPAHADALPKEMLGLWAFELADCSNPGSDGFLKIEAKAVRFFASSYDIKRVLRRPDGSVSASGVVSNEGEQGRRPGSLMLKLIAPERLLALDHVYQRCR